MTGYRLTFGTLSMRTSMSDLIDGVLTTIGEAIGSLSETVEVLGHDYYLGTTGAAQFVIRFAAASDEMAAAAASAALGAVSLPVDGERIERRSRRYVPVG